MTSRMFKTPLVVVLGATGAGKSKLALQLAERFQGEIISADAMQMYKGLDIITNKVSPTELSVVKHHMIDFLDPLSNIQITDFRDMSLPIIRRLLSQNTIPFICGGTNYYIESLLWDFLVPKTYEDKVKEKPIRSKEEDYELKSTELLHSSLRSVDPERASELHRNNRRKIIRSLQVYDSTGIKHSDILKEQRAQEGGSIFGGPLLFHNVVFLWVSTELSLLDERNNKRIDKMIQDGMMEELEAFHRDYNSKRETPGDYTLGIFQSIGFKEFHSYLELPSKEAKGSKEGLKLLEKGINSMKIATRQYARRQLRWIRRRLLNPLLTSRPLIYSLDSSVESSWNTKVLEPAIHILESFLIGENPKYPSVPCTITSNVSPEDLKRIYFCSFCDAELNGIEQYNAHLRGNKHKRRKEKTKKKYTIVILGDSKSQISDSNPSHSQLSLIKLYKGITKKPLSEVKELLHLSSSPLNLNVSFSESVAKEFVTKLKDFGVIGECQCLD